MLSRTDFFDIAEASGDSVHSAGRKSLPEHCGYKYLLHLQVLLRSALLLKASPETPLRRSDVSAVCPNVECHVLCYEH